MVKRSAGLLLYRTKNGFVEVFLAHPGGPFYVKKDAGVWSIPKGEFDTEEPFAAARREFEEETGFRIAGEFIELPAIKQKAGKIVYAWAVEADIDADAIHSNTFEMEWPPHSGKTATFPEIDRAAWFVPEIRNPQSARPTESEITEELPEEALPVLNTTAGTASPTLLQGALHPVPDAFLNSSFRIDHSHSQTPRPAALITELLTRI